MPAGRICPEPGCPAITPGGRCPAHARPPSHRRGYDHRHIRERATWQRRLDQGERVDCWRCGKRIDRDPSSWDLGHVDDERDTATRRAKRWPEHSRECNRREAGRTSAATH